MARGALGKIVIVYLSIILYAESWHPFDLVLLLNRDLKSTQSLDANQ